MKKQLTVWAALLFATAVFFSSCKKESSTNTDDTLLETEAKANADDQSRFSTETDMVADDANLAIESFGGSYAGARPMNPTPLPARCGTVTVDTSSNPRTITITYDDTTCLVGNRRRTGSVLIKFGPDFRWARAGASFTVTYQNLRITRVSTGKSIVINGTKTVTNVSGGRLRNLASLGNIVHTVTSDGMTVTFDNGSQRNWQIARQRSFTYDNGIVVAVTGIGTVATGAAEWGTNRFGREFKNIIVTPLVFKQSCDFKLVSGQAQHVTPAVTVTTTFGLDATGNNPVTDCSAQLYLKIVWQGVNGQTRTYTGPY